MYILYVWYIVCMVYAMCGIFHVCVKKSQRQLILLYMAGLNRFRKTKKIPLDFFFNLASFGVSHITVTFIEQELRPKEVGELIYNQSIKFGDATKEWACFVVNAGRFGR